jgi:hypothetical protein
MHVNSLKFAWIKPKKTKKPEEDRNINELNQRKQATPT